MIEAAVAEAPTPRGMATWTGTAGATIVSEGGCKGGKREPPPAVAALAEAAVALGEMCLSEPIVLDTEVMVLFESLLPAVVCGTLPPTAVELAPGVELAELLCDCWACRTSCAWLASRISGSGSVGFVASGGKRLPFNPEAGWS